MNERRRGGPAPMSYDECAARVELVNEMQDEGFPLEAKPGVRTAQGEAARRSGVTHKAFMDSLTRAKTDYGLEPDPLRYVRREAAAPFEIADLPHDGEPSAEELIGHLKAKFIQKQAHEEAKRLIDVRVNMDGPIGIVFFGDPHVDSNGTDWPALERDVAICRDTPGIMAVSVGDARDNWVGRLMRLYANAEVTAKQSITLIEWLFTQLPWLLTIGGNHDKWNGEGGDAAAIIHRLQKCPGLYEDDGARMRLLLPGGADFNMHVRHDFPGHSQFNGGHAFVRETLFGYRDHVMACGHRHSSAYMPVWHNDPMRLCQGFRCGSYKRIDTFQKEKHFKIENWAPSMGVVVNPDRAHDPVRFIERCFSAEEVAEKLTDARARWERGRAA